MMNQHHEALKKEIFALAEVTVPGMEIGSTMQSDFQSLFRFQQVMLSGLMNPQVNEKILAYAQELLESTPK